MTTTGPKNVLIVEDDHDIRELLRVTLKSDKFHLIVPEYVEGKGDFPSAIIEAVKNNEVHIAVCDLTLPDANHKMSVSVGLKLMKQIREIGFGTHVIALTGSIDRTAVAHLERIGATMAFSKDDPDLREKLRDALDELADTPRF